MVSVVLNIINNKEIIMSTEGAHGGGGVDNNLYNAWKNYDNNRATHQLKFNSKSKQWESEKLGFVNQKIRNKFASYKTSVSHEAVEAYADHLRSKGFEGKKGIIQLNLGALKGTDKEIYDFITKDINDKSRFNTMVGDPKLTQALNFKDTGLI